MTTEITTQKEGRDRLRGLMHAMRAQIAETLPKHLKPETMIRVVLVEGSRNPDLRLCTPESLAGSIILASQLGLEPSGPLGRFYLIPRREKLDPRDRNSPKVWRCGFVIGYRGYVELARRAGLRVNAGCVFNGEIERGSFTWQEEPPELMHKGIPGVDRTEEAFALSYAVAVDERRGRAGHRWQLVLEREQVNESRRAAGTDRIWSKHFLAMARKTALRRLLAGGLVPLSAELERAVQAERAVELEAAEVIEAELEPVEVPRAAQADPLRQALQLDAPPVDVEAVEQEAREVAELSAIARDLEGPLEQEQLSKAVESSGLLPDIELEEQPVEALRLYVQALDAAP